MLPALWLTLPVLGGGIILLICLKKKWCNKLRYPIDAYQEFNGKRLFGDHKTWLGVTAMSVSAAVIGLVLWIFQPELRALLPFSDVISALVGFAIIGIAYSVGELPNSFMKRQLNISPGEIPDSHLRYFVQLIDLIDGVVVVGIVYIFLYLVDPPIILLAMMLGVIIHYVIHKAMIQLHLKKE